VRKARGFHPHAPLGEAAAGAANIKHVFDSMERLTGCQPGSVFPHKATNRPSSCPEQASSVAVCGDTPATRLLAVLTRYPQAEKEGADP
jgi:hypothetical protein